MHVIFLYRNEENLGIAYLSSVLKGGGHTTDLVFSFGADPFFGRERKSKAKDSVVSGILNKSPDLVAMSVVTEDFPFVCDIGRRIKEKADIPVILGGHHVIAVPERVIEEKFVDIICTGEGERPLLELADRFMDYKAGRELSIPGIWYKMNGKVYKGAQRIPYDDLDAFPFPDKGLFYNKAPFFKDEYLAIASRGCPNRCTYCFNWLNNPIYAIAPRLRRRSVKNIIEELLWARERWAIKRVFFFDDAFTFNKGWLSQFAQEYKKRISLPFSCVTNVSYIDRDVVHALKEGGCIKVCVGIQSWNSELRRDILNRREDNKNIINAISLLKEAGMYVQTDHILGIPGETLSDHIEAVRYYNMVRPHHISVYWLKYYPGTNLIKILEDKGIISDADKERIEKGTYTENSYMQGGSVKAPERLYGIFILLNYMPVIPPLMVKLIMKIRLYNYIRIRSFFLNRIVPRVIKTILFKNDVSGRYYIKKFVFLLKRSIKGIRLKN